MTAPFQSAAPRESARWRPATTDLLTKTREQREEEERARLIAAQEAKPVRQRAFEKTAMSLTVQLLILGACFLAGVVTRTLFGRDVGPLLFWANQCFVVALFLGFPEDSGATSVSVDALRVKLESLSGFDKATLASQLVPWVYCFFVARSFSSYGALVVALVGQTMAKLGVMVAGNAVVNTVL